MTSSPILQHREPRLRGAGVTAVLGPTNTGKTHLAIERMVSHSSGLIGLPLRLLAREVYNRIVEKVGPEQVALVTGEEKIKPEKARYWVSTVEAMPLDLDVAFVAIDEIQMCADFERGHVFTDRLLNRRGREETLLLGAATMRPLIEQLLPGVNVLARPRLSNLTFSGEKKITRLPRRSAIVAFSAEEVYAIAELIRRQRGGAAVVLGALSPRTRNAQVAMYQSGDVDYLVATDAIGMGLNLDVDHVAFASDRKFDGYQFRKLAPVEFAQIAGRAGRHTRDGTFGSTGRCPPFDDEMVRALESHAFDSTKVLQWRNSALDFASVGALQASLAAPPTLKGLARAPVAEDVLVLDHASRDEAARDMAKGRAAVARLWEVCQVPDYRKISPSAHAELVTTLYGFLMREGSVPDDWFASQIAQGDRTEGGIDTLSARIAHIRTWTFVANRLDWLKDPQHWQGVARAVEDRLSDALHERLAERFVDRRTSVLMRRLKENTMLETEISKTGDVVVEGHTIGRLEGFRFAPDASAGGSEARIISGAAQKALASEIEARAMRLSQSPDSQFVLAADGTLRWIGEAVAKLTAGDNVLRPRVRILSDEHLTGAAQEAVQTRLDLWTRASIERSLGPLFVLGAAEDITGIARGIAYQIVESLGVLDRTQVANDVKTLEQAARATLRSHGVRFGAYHLYVPSLLKPGPRSLAAQLWALKNGGPELKGLDDLQRLASSGRTSFAVEKDTTPALVRTLGYRVAGERAVRVDILERLADLIRPAIAWRNGASGAKPAGAFGGGGFMVTQAMTSLTGSSGEDFATILRSLGYRMEKRPKPVEAVAPTEPVVAEAAAAETSAVDPAAEAEVHVDAQPEAPVADVPVAEPAAQAEPVAPEAAAPEAAAVETPAESPIAEAPVDAQASAETKPEEAAQEPALVEVWRPGGRSEERRPRHRRPQRKQEAAKPAEGAAAEASAEGAQAATPGEAAPAGDRQQHHRRGGHHRDRNREERKDGDQRPARPDQGRSDRGERRPDQGRPELKGGDGRPPRRDGRPGGRDRDRDRDRDRGGARPREWSSANTGGNEPDPNSPFAKLAALKAQLEGGKN